MTVLYVDEKGAQQRAFVRECEGAGYKNLEHVTTITPTRDIDATIEKILSKESHALVTDFNLSEEGSGITYTGLDLRKKMKSTRSFYPILVITHFIDHALQAGESVWHIYDKDDVLANDTRAVDHQNIASFFARLDREINSCQENLEEAMKNHTLLAMKLANDDITTKEFERLCELDSAITKAFGERDTISFESLTTAQNPTLKLIDESRELIATLKRKFEG